MIPNSAHTHQAFPRMISSFLFYKRGGHLPLALVWSLLDLHFPSEIAWAAGETCLLVNPKGTEGISQRQLVSPQHWWHHRRFYCSPGYKRISREDTTGDVTGKCHSLLANYLHPDWPGSAVTFPETHFWAREHPFAHSPSTTSEFSLLHYNSVAEDRESWLKPWYG